MPMPQPATGGADTLATYRHLRDSAAAFHGPAISSSDTGVLLGVLAPLSHVAGNELLAAVQLAVDQANGDGGIGGRECRLLHLSDDQTWHIYFTSTNATDSRRMGLLRSSVGWMARAHTAELVVAKLWVPLVSPVSPTAADRSVDVANVPWVFGLIPDEIIQAQMLVQAAQVRGWTNLRVVDDR